MLVMGFFADLFNKIKCHELWCGYNHNKKLILIVTIKS